MVNIKLGNATYEEVSKIRFDTTEGGSQEFVLYDDAFEDGRVKGEEEGYREGYDVGKSDGHDEGFEAGKTEGYAEGKEVGIAEGAQNEWSTFWDGFQNKGYRKTYTAAFANGWNDDMFKPKYDIINGRYSMQVFQYSAITDLADKLEKLGLALDISAVENGTQFFQGAAIKHIPTLDMRAMKITAYMFATDAKVETIDKLIVSETTQFVATTFNTAASLQNITFEGTIGSLIDFQWSPLTAASIDSVITHLSDTATGQTATFMLSAVNTAFETADGAADGATSQAWLDLVATKPNWTISLV